MNWDGFGEDEDDDHFFESYERMSSAVPLDLASSGSDDEFEDGRMSFASAISSVSIKSLHPIGSMARPSSCMLGNYDMWTSEPGDINERRKRLLQGMGLTSKKNLAPARSKVVRTVSKKPSPVQVPAQVSVPIVVESTTPAIEESKRKRYDVSDTSITKTPTFLGRSRSDGDINVFSANTKQRKEELVGSVSKQRLTRTLSGQLGKSKGVCQYSNDIQMSPGRLKTRSTEQNNDMVSGGAFGSFFLIKNLDTGKEFIVKESNEKGMWNKLSDVQTGKQLTMEEFEKSVGFSPVVKELMRRRNAQEDGRKVNHQNSLLTKSFRNSKRMGAAFLKNLTTSRSVSKSERDHENSSQVVQKAPKNTSQWVKTRQHGKSYKEFTALHMSQEIQAHEGSIWTIKFSCDGRYLASAGEDRLIHVWEVQECDVMSTRSVDDWSSCGGTPVHPMAGNVSDSPPLALITSLPSDRRVVDWIDIHEMVTAACYTPDGQGAVIGSHQGSCHVYNIDDEKMEHHMDIQIKKKAPVKIIPGFQSQAKTQAQFAKITGLQFDPSKKSELLITSANSRIRIHHESELIQKFRGFRNTSSQIAASFTPDGNHVISASEDSHVYIWKVEEPKNQGSGKAKSKTTVFANEHFHCKDVSVAIPWPGNILIEPPIVEIHSKRHSRRISAPPQHSIGGSARQDNLVDAGSKRHLPPLPKKNNVLERIPSSADEEFGHSARIDPGIGVSESFCSSPAISYGDSPSISASGASPSQSRSSSWSLYDHNGSTNGNGGQTVQATAWGMVIVTASVEGEIRVYQNFGLPLKVSRQPHLFS